MEVRPTSGFETMPIEREEHRRTIHDALREIRNAVDRDCNERCDLAESRRLKQETDEFEAELLGASR